MRSEVQAPHLRPIVKAVLVAIVVGANLMAGVAISLRMFHDWRVARMRDAERAYVEKYSNRAIETTDGDLYFNTNTGLTQIPGATHILEKHNPGPTLYGCFGELAPGSSDFAGTIVVPEGDRRRVALDTDIDCEIRFNVGYTSIPTCQLTSREAWARNVLSWSVKTTGIRFNQPYTAVDYVCVGH